MQPVTISIVYHSERGHTKQIAEILDENLRSEFSRVHLLTVDEAKESLHILHESDTIVFGCPTYLGNVSASFKQFMEVTGSFWYNQLWKDKLAAAFTVSSARGGDKLNTLISIALFAAQHSMLWISQGIMPRFCNSEQTEGQNRLGSYLGLMIQSDNGTELNPPLTGDILTAELFAKRILDITLKFQGTRSYSYESIRN